MLTDPFIMCNVFKASCFAALFHCRHVIIPKEMVKTLPKKLMSEDEWRAFGVQQSQGWIHYMTHEPGDSFVARLVSRFII